MIRILLAEDHDGMREEMKKFIGRDPEMSIVAEVTGGAAAIEAAERVRPDVVVMDIVLPGVNGIEAIRSIVTRRPETRVLALSNYHGHTLVQNVLLAGGLGFLPKELLFEELLPAIRAVAAWKVYISDDAVPT